MRILIDYRPALRQRSGVGEYIHQLAVALRRTRPSPPGEEITLFSSSWKDRLDPEAPGDALFDRRVPVKLLNLLWHRFEWPPVEALTGGSFDLVHSPHPLLLPARDAARVVTIHDLDFLRHPERTRDEMRRDYPVLAQRHARRADCIVVPSQYTAHQVERLLDVPATRVVLCPWGAPGWKARPGLPADGYILLLGTLEARKNVGTLLEAYRQLLSRHRRLPRLVLAGRATPAAARWLEAIAAPPFAGRVEYRGYIPDAERRDVYAGARLLVVPSLDEGFGLPALEAMTVGVPVVASNRGALPEVIGDAGLFVEAEDADSLAGAIERVLFDEACAGTLAARGVMRARQFNWEHAAGVVRAAWTAAVAARRSETHAHRH